MIGGNQKTGLPSKILLLGSGGLSIGQAGEFDYSGNQALKAMREEGVEVVLINPNIATVQTNPEENVSVYLYPVEAEWVERVIEKERPDGIIASFGGQTALNCLLALDERNVLQKYAVENLGTPVSVLRMTEDRDEFSSAMQSINQPVPASFACENLADAKSAADQVGYPVIVRAAYTLGGLGSGFAENTDELEELVIGALASSPQVLVEKSLRGWKELEYEVMRDRQSNCITICNMENLDPMGIHTGDSIVVAPSQTLSDADYQMLRDASLHIVNSLGVVGECNVQFALSADSAEYFVIEVNARLSRSSALASKATGYPIAYIASKVVLGYDLLELPNPVTGITCAFFEPALDYVAVKIPRWDLSKFIRVSKSLGSTMKSVGEVMAIGRTFPEALQKAVRMVSENMMGLSRIHPEMEDNYREILQQATDTRLFAVVEALRKGLDRKEVHDLTKIDQWFLHHIEQIVRTEQEIQSLAGGADIGAPAATVTSIFKQIEEQQWRNWKSLGFGDEQIAGLVLDECATTTEYSLAEVQQASLTVRALRLACGVRPVVKKIDTTAGEYPSPSNYVYMTYGGSFDDPLTTIGQEESAVILGGGAYRIGASVEFDWCAVSCSRRMQALGWKSVMINCNPETVSTDYNSCDRLYFDELSLERILDITAFENVRSVVACMGGQLPNQLAIPLSATGLNILGHSASTIDAAENRSTFSALLDELQIDQPQWVSATSKEDIQNFVQAVGFPILIRPSYVLSGAAMNVAYNTDSLAKFMGRAELISPDHPVVLSEFVLGAREIELDGVAQDGNLVHSIISEHIENAGVHSGDATVVVPAQRLYVETIRQVKKAARLIVERLHLNGPFNMQFLSKDSSLKVIECNVRAARSFPFVSKTIGLNLADLSTDVLIGLPVDPPKIDEDELPFVGVKSAMFSFTRLSGADPILGVEMAATGEVGCIADTFSEALLLSLQSSGIVAPRKGVLVSSGAEKDKLGFLESAEILRKLNVPLFATHGTGGYLRDHGYDVTELGWIGEEENDCLKAIKMGWVDLVINIPKSLRSDELTRGSRVRQAAARLGCPLMTNMQQVVAFMRAIDAHRDLVLSHSVRPLPAYLPHSSQKVANVHCEKPGYWQLRD